MSASKTPQQVNWQLGDYAYFRKCGEITVSPDEQRFGLNCQFCPGICLEFDFFMQHLREAHAEDIKALYCDDDGTTTTTAANKREQTTQTELILTEVVVDTTTTTAAAAAAIANTTTAALATATSTTTAINVNEESTWNETSAKNSTVTPTTYAGVVSEAMEEMQPEAPQEAVGLVYIMESAPQEEEIIEEETVDPFEMFIVGDNQCERVSVGSGDGRSGGGDGVDDVANGGWRDSDEEEVEEEEEEEKDDGEAEEETPVNSDENLNRKCITEKKEKVQNSKSPTMSEVEHSKEVISYLLEAYKQNEKLWNPNHPNYKYNANRKMFNVLAESLLKDMNYELCETEIYAIIRGLRSRYRRELTKMKIRKGNYKTRFKFFEQMHFLRDAIESKRIERDAKNRNEVDETEQTIKTNSDPTKSVPNRDVLLFLLTAYKRLECLWNTKHADYANCNKTALYNEISTQLLEDMDISMSGDNCLVEIKKLRTRYSKELHVLIKHKGLYVPKLWCFDEMEFLRSIFQDQILKRLNKRIGVIACKPKTQYLKAKPINFKSIDESLTFIEIYRNYSALWDVDHPDFRSATYRTNELNAMLEEVNLTFEYNATLDQLQKTLFRLRKEYTTEKQKELSGKTSIPTDVTSNSLIYSKLSEFLEPNLGPFQCDVCNAIIRTSDKYKIHKSGHDGRQPFICTLCGKGFQMPGNLTVHIRRHKRDFPYACEICDKRFATSTEVAIHLRTHTGERPYICDLCGKSFKTWSFFDIHRRIHLKKSNFLCPICNKAFYERNRYTDHMNGHLNIRKHCCEVCGKSFTTFGNLRKHNELHLPVKKYKCGDCGKRYAQFASLRWHKRTAHADAATQQMEQ